MGKNKNWFIESTVEAGEVIINDGGSAVDFRIEGDTDSNLFVTDGSADKVGIGTNAPDTKLHVTSDTIGTLLSVSNHNVSSSMPPEMVFQKSRGSKIAPATLSNSDEIGKITFKGYDGSTYDELAHIKVSSSDVSADTSSMTFHSDKFVLDTGTLQFGTAGDAVSAISTAVDANSTDLQLCTAKAAYTALAGGVITFNNTTGSVAYTNADVAGNVGKVYYLASHSSDGTFAPSILEADAARVHVGGDVDTNYVFKVTGASGLVGDTTITGATQVTGALTVGVDDTGHDVKLFGATSGKYILWDESEDTLKLGVNDTGVDFIAYGATNLKKLHWDESQDSLLIHGGAELGHADSDVLKVHGGFKLYDTNAIFNIKAVSSSQANDIFQVYDKNDTLSLSVENSGAVEVADNLKFTNKQVNNITMDQLTIGTVGAISHIDYDDGTGGKSFGIFRNSVVRMYIDASNNFTRNGVTSTDYFTGEYKIRAQNVAINSATDSASLGVLAVSKVTTSSGNLNLDSSGGTVAIDDNVTITGDISVTGSSNFSGTTSDSFHLGTASGNNIGWKSISLSDSADNTAPGLARTKYLHPVDSTGNAGTAGIAVNNIHSESSMTISTKDASDLLILAPGYNYDSGDVVIGTSVSKQSNLLCYGNATISGNLTVSGTIDGTVSANGTSATSFQFDNAGNGSKINIGSDDIIQTVDKDGTANPLHSTGILLDDVYGGSSKLSLTSYNENILMTPGSNANTKRFVKIVGSLSVDGSTSLSYNYIGGAGTKIGTVGNSSFGVSDDLASGDTKIYMANGEMFFDSSENTASFRTSDLVFGASDTSGSNSTDGNQVKFYGNATAAYMQWLQSSNKLILNGNGVGSEILNVKAGNAIFGVSGEDKCDVKFNGAAGEILDIDSGNSYAKFSQGFRRTPNVKDSTVTLTQQESGRAIIIKNKTADATYTLPATAIGLNYKFMIVEKTGAYDIEIKSPSASNFFFGGVTHLDTDAGSAADEIVTVVSNNSTNDFLTLTLVEAGSMVEMYCDGTNWFVTGHVASATAPAFGDASGL